MLSYIQNNPQETQRLVSVKYDQLEQLIKQAIARVKASHRKVFAFFGDV
jgi:hypothetical protein